MSEANQHAEPHGAPAQPKKRSWPSMGAKVLGSAESGVLIMIGLVLVILAVMMLESSVATIFHAVQENKIHEEAIEILNGVLLVMMTMEIVYTVAISLEAHALVAEPFLIIGAIAAIRRMLVITAASTKDEHDFPEAFRNTLYELALLALIVISMALAIYILKRAAILRAPKDEGHDDAPGH